MALGHSVCTTEPELDGPAILTASVRDSRICMWHVYEDPPENRVPLGLGIS